MTPDQWIALATVVIAIATAVNVAVSKGLWKQTKASVDVARNHFQVTDRPYVGVDYVELIAPEPDLGSRRVRAITQNFGPFPAHNLSVQWDGFVDGKHLRKSRLSEEESVLLFPGGKYTSTGDLAPEVASAITDGRSTLVVRVKSDYQDAQGNPHHTRQKYQYDPRTEGFVGIESEGA